MALASPLAACARNYPLAGTPPHPAWTAPGPLQPTVAPYPSRNLFLFNEFL